MLGALLHNAASSVEAVAADWPPVWAGALTAAERRDVRRVAERLRELGRRLGASASVAGGSR